MVSIAVSQGVAAADEAMAEVQAAIWRSEDLREIVASIAQRPRQARFQGR